MNHELFVINDALSRHANELKFFIEADTFQKKYRGRQITLAESWDRSKKIRKMRYKSLNVLYDAALWNTRAAVCVVIESLEKQIRGKQFDPDDRHDVYLYNRLKAARDLSHALESINPITYRKFNPNHDELGRFASGPGGGGGANSNGSFQEAMAVIPAGEAAAEAVASAEEAAAAIRAGSAATATEASAASEEAGWKLGGFKSEQTWANQMESRSWTSEQITNTIENGEQFPAPNYVNPGNTATRYQDPTTGRYVVRDDQTKEILQISGKNFEPSLIPKKVRATSFISLNNIVIGGDKRFFPKELKMSLPQTIEIYIQLLADEKGTLRPTQAIPLGHGLYKVLPIPDYDKVGEVWEFPPGSIVRCERRHGQVIKDMLLAISKGQ